MTRKVYSFLYLLLPTRSSGVVTFEFPFGKVTEAVESGVMVGVTRSRSL